MDLNKKKPIPIKVLILELAETDRFELSEELIPRLLSR